MRLHTFRSLISKTLLNKSHKKGKEVHHTPQLTVKEIIIKVGVRDLKAVQAKAVSEVDLVRVTDRIVV
jgi:glutaredoxin